MNIPKIENLAVDVRGNVGIVELDKPPHNFFDLQLISSLAGVLEEFDRMTEVRAIVLGARGKSFCAGADFGSQADAKASPGAPPPRPGQLYDEALRIFRCRKPIVAAVIGAAIGGGMGLALAADFRVTCAGARFAANFTRIGFHPGFGLTVTLPRLLGTNAAELLFYTGRRVTGTEAATMGLANVLAPEDQVLARAVELAEEIAQSSPLGVVATRETMRRGLVDAVTDATRREMFAQIGLRDTEDFAEGVRAYGERRAPVFRGR